MQSSAQDAGQVYFYLSQRVKTGSIVESAIIQSIKDDKKEEKIKDKWNLQYSYQLESYYF